MTLIKGIQRKRRSPARPNHTVIQKTVVEWRDCCLKANSIKSHGDGYLLEAYRRASWTSPRLLLQSRYEAYNFPIQHSIKTEVCSKETKYENHVQNIPGSAKITKAVSIQNRGALILNDS